MLRPGIDPLQASASTHILCTLFGNSLKFKRVKYIRTYANLFITSTNYTCQWNYNNLFLFPLSATNTTTRPQRQLNLVYLLTLQCLSSSFVSAHQLLNNAHYEKEVNNIRKVYVQVLCYITWYLRPSITKKNSIYTKNFIINYNHTSDEIKLKSITIPTKPFQCVIVVRMIA